MGAALAVTAPGGAMVGRSDRAAGADEAMERYADGDEAAFDDLFDALEPRLRRFALALTGSGAAADDVIQQTLLQIHLSRSRFARGAAVVPWAYAIARNFIRDIQRRRSTELRFAGDIAAPEPPRPDEALDEQRRRAVVDEEVWRLPEPLREAFLLVNVEELPTAEAAAILGISAANVKVRAHRARKALAAGTALRLKL